MKQIRYRQLRWGKRRAAPWHLCRYCRTPVYPGKISDHRDCAAKALKLSGKDESSERPNH